VRIAISPDENLGDSGSVSASGVTERSVNLSVAWRLVSALARCGQDVWLDPNISYVERVRQANADGTRLLVACAHNESTPGRSGTQFVFCPGGVTFGRQAEAARQVYAQLANIPSWPPRRPDAIEAVYECCQFDYDTVYIEYLYMSPDDEPLWSADWYAQAAAEATAAALARTYGFTYVAHSDHVISGLRSPWWWDASG
jgi:N-acetylmuramoyl-L-alanine amidase